MLHLFLCRMLGEVAVLSTYYLLQIGNINLSSNFIPDLDSSSILKLPDHNLTINDIKISPIDDHLTFGQQM